MEEYSQLLSSKFNSEKISAHLSIYQQFSDMNKNKIHNTDKGIIKFYTESKVDSLYKLFYARYTTDDSHDAIYQHSITSRNMASISDEQQREELQKYLKFEITICMKRSKANTCKQGPHQSPVLNYCGLMRSKRATILTSSKLR